MKSPPVRSHKSVVITFFILGVVSGIICAYYVVDRVLLVSQSNSEVIILKPGAKEQASTVSATTESDSEFCTGDMTFGLNSLNPTYATFHRDQFHMKSKLRTDFKHIRLHTYRLRITFKSVTGEGILFFSSGSSNDEQVQKKAEANDYIAGYLHNGCVIHCCMKTNVRDRISVKFCQDKVNKSINFTVVDKWHDLVFKKNDNKIIICSITHKRCTLIGRTGKLKPAYSDIAPVYYFGGVPEHLKDTAKALLGTSEGFQGCITNVTFNKGTTPGQPTFHYSKTHAERTTK